jgi:hypothetical protein
VKTENSGDGLILENNINIDLMYIVLHASSASESLRRHVINAGSFEGLVTSQLVRTCSRSRCHALSTY